ncbi:glutamyl-tRNA reductase [Nocardioides daphniae]|uniref:glutamyl-tRNA reductase n=1 Tax=Nocardioides daphniae TaxID=402297 RepID=UPI0026CF5B48
MSVLVVGISHKSAPVSVLESLALDADGARKLVLDAVEADHVGEVAVISTCNRLEIYADVERFHGSVEDLSRLLVARSGAAPETMVPHLYVHYEDGAVSHLFHVAAGMDSMVLGEGQILGQAREALRVGQELGTVGPALNSLFQQALRVGKRTHAETDVDSAAPSMVSAALGEALGDDGVRGVSALVLGAGSMASLAVATLTRQGARQVVVANRSLANAERLAAEYGVRAVPMDELSDELGTADVLITCTGASGVVLTAAEVAEARDGRTQPLTVLDLALPHDVDPAAAELPGVEVLGLADLADRLGRDHEAVRSVDGVREIVAEEVQAFLSPVARRRSPRPWWRCARWPPASWSRSWSASRRAWVTPIPR